MTRLTNFAAALAGLVATAGLCPDGAWAQRTISPDAALAQRTISNVATVEWDAGAQHMSRPSNRVDIVREAAPAAVDSAATFRFASSGPASAAAASTSCGVGTAAHAVSFGPAWTDVAMDAMGLVATTSYKAGEPLVVVFAYAPGNLDSAAADRVAITLRTADGDREALTLTETGADTGRFAGAVPTIGGSMPVVDDCRITVHAGATTQLSILDTSGAEIARAAISYLIDPFGIVFDSGTGDPVAGVRVTLIDAATGRAADVFGDDGVSVYPSTVVTGQSITDGGARATTFRRAITASR